MGAGVSGNLLAAIANPDPQTKLIDPGTVALTKQRLLAGQGEMQEQQLKNQMLRQQVEDVATTRQFAAKHNGDWGAILKDPDYLASVNPSTALGIQKSVLENQDKIADTKSKVATANDAQAKADQAHADLVGDLATRAKEANYSLPVIDSILTQMEQVDPKNAQHTEQIRQVIAQDPTKAPQLIDGFITAAQQQKMQAAALAAQKESREAQAAQVTAEGTRAGTAEKIRAQAIEDSALISDQDSYAKWAAKYPSVAGNLPTKFDPGIIATLQRSSVPVKEQPEFDIKATEAAAAKNASPAGDMKLVDSVIPIGSPLNARTKAQVAAARQSGMGAATIAGILKDASNQIGKTETAVATANAETPGKIAAAVATGRAMNGTGPTANVPPHLAPAAIAAYNKSGEALAQAQTDSDDIQKVLDLAGAGNKAAGANVPMLGVGAVNAINGIKRITSAEIAQYGSAGSLLDKIQGKLQGWVEGQPIPADVLKDMKSLHDTLAESALAKHSREVQSINNSYGSSFEPMKFQAAKPSAPIRARDPQGKLHEAPAGTTLPAGWKLEK